MTRISLFPILALLASCATPAPPVEVSREILWNQFGHQKVDTILLAWGPPAAETRLTDNSRIVAYRHATTWDAQSPYEYSVGCEVSFLAKSPRYFIEDIAMQGDGRECSLLAQGQLGSVRHVYLPPPPPPYPYHPYYSPYWW